MTWPLWLRQKVRDFVDLAAQGAWPQMRDQARRLAREIPPEEPRVPGARASSRAKPRGGVDKSGLPFAPVAPGRPKEDRKALRAAGMRRIWIAVHARAGKRCEWCRWGEAVEVHHVISGGGARQAHEDPTSCCGLCEECHRRTEAEPLWDLRQSLAWARRLGFTATAEILEGKLALAEAQARTPTTEDDAA